LICEKILELLVIALEMKMPFLEEMMMHAERVLKMDQNFQNSNLEWNQQWVMLMRRFVEASANAGSFGRWECDCGV